MELKLNDEAVLMDIDDTFGAIPISFNGRYSPEHSCRGRITKIGRRFVHLKGNEKTAWKVLPYQEGMSGRFAVPVEIAKELYKEALIKNRAWRTDEFIAKCVEEL